MPNLDQIPPHPPMPVYNPADYAGPGAGHHDVSGNHFQPPEMSGGLDPSYFPPPNVQVPGLANPGVRDVPGPGAGDSRVSEPEEGALPFVFLSIPFKSLHLPSIQHANIIIL